MQMPFRRLRNPVWDSGLLGCAEVSQAETDRFQASSALRLAAFASDNFQADYTGIC